MARFFISHGASEGSSAEEVLHAMCRRLTDLQHEPFADTMILAGEPWRPRLYDELCRCDVGIVLLDRRALGSNWVRREVHYLLWRHHLRSVRIMVVLLDGLTVRELRRDGYAELAEIQMIHADRERDLEAVLARTLSGIGPAPAVPDRMQRWLRILQTIIRQVQDGGMLAHFALDIGIPKDDLDNVLEHERSRFVAHQLIGRPRPMQTQSAILAIKQALGRDPAARLAESALPALVDAEAARHLLRRAATEPAQQAPVFVLNATKEVTPQLYVLRAVCGDPDIGYCAVSATGGVDLVTELMRRCEAQLMQMLGIRERDEKQARKRLAEYRDLPLYRRGVEFAYLAIDAAHGQMTAVAAVIHRLRDAHPWLSMIVLSGPEVPADIEAWGLGNVVVLDPPLADGDDNELDEVINRLRMRVDGRLLND